jgi:outer membrane protein TolC
MVPSNRRQWILGTVVLAAWTAPVGFAQTLSPGTGGQGPQAPESAPMPRPLAPGSPEAPSQVSPAYPPANCTDPAKVLQGPALSEGGMPQRMPPAQPDAGEQPLPINLATALRLADARPLLIAAAQARLREALAVWDQTRVYWLPNTYVGADYYGHVGPAEGVSGNQFTNDRSQFLAGGGLYAMVATTDAIFEPLAQRQVVRAREAQVQAARNDALLAVAEAYFSVQQARGQLSGAEDVVAKSRDLARRIADLGKTLTAPVEINRALTQLADMRQVVAAMREQWEVASADLTLVLRLNPAAVVIPLEPPHVQVTLVSPQEAVDNLIPIGLMSRPELAANQALVRATLMRLKEERWRPLIPSVVLMGTPAQMTAGGYLMGGIYGSGLAPGHGNPWGGRFDPNVQVLWELKNMGFGNRALIRQRQAQVDEATIELFHVQDRVAAEVARAHAQVKWSAVRAREAETQLQQAQINFAGNLRGLEETSRIEKTLVLVIRPQEAVASLRQLYRAYENYFATVNEYNRAQFRLFRAMGYPAEILACERTPGEVQPVDTSRPAPLPPVKAPEPCTRCPGPK